MLVCELQNFTQKPVGRWTDGDRECLVDRPMRATGRIAEIWKRPGYTTRTESPRMVEGDSWASQFLFAMCWVFIGAVSCFDAYLIVKFKDTLPMMELNPLGSLLLELDGGEPSLFVAAKFLGTMLVLGILFALRQKNRRMAGITAGSIAVFQFGLLMFLTVSLPL